MVQIAKPLQVIGFFFAMGLLALSAKPAAAVVCNDPGGDINTIGTAAVCPPGSDSISGTLDGPSPDIYRLDFTGLPNPVSFNAFNLLASFTTSDTETDIHLLDVGGATLQTCADCFENWAGGGLTFLAQALTPGVYYLEIEYGDLRGDFSFQFAPATVPVPAALPLFLSGLAAFALVARRRRAKGLAAG